MSILLFIGKDGDQGQRLVCLVCHSLIANSADVVGILGRSPRGVYMNPNGLECPIVTFSQAGPLRKAEFSSTENTWFAGYAWRPVSCARCNLFVGWQFEGVGDADPQQFFGLLEDRLVEG